MKFDKNKKLSTGEVARLCGATTASVNNWIKSKKIKAYNTPGGQYRILVKDLIKFIRQNNMPVPEELKDLIKKRILIIDNDKTNLQILKRSINEIPLHMDIYTTCEKYSALITLGDMKPDVLFLNYELYGNDTEKIYESIKHFESLSRTIIFIIDGGMPYHKNYSGKIQLYNDDEFIEKPLSIEKIKNILQKTLNL